MNTRQFITVVLGLALSAGAWAAQPADPQAAPPNPAGAPAQSEADINMRVDDLVGRHYMDGIPYPVANALGPAALPHLFELLGNADQKPFWVNIIVTIGFIEDAAAIGPLVSFLEKTPGEVDHFTFRALLSVPYSLGCIAAGGDNVSLAYLTGNIQASQSRALGWSFQGKPAAELIAEQSVMALAVSGRPEARNLLLDLQGRLAQATGPQTSAVRSDNVDQGLAIMDRIASEGRAAILNPRRGNGKGGRNE
jgi:hypothetical protein